MKFAQSSPQSIVNFTDVVKSIYKHSCEICGSAISFPISRIEEVLGSAGYLFGTFFLLCYTL